jgi:hypothetical protein
MRNPRWKDDVLAFIAAVTLASVGLTVGLTSGWLAYEFIFN